jgi:hypothetical protein
MVDWFYDIFNYIIIDYFVFLLIWLLLFINIYVISYLFFFSSVSIRLYDRNEVKPCVNSNEFICLFIYKLVHLKIVSIIRVILCRT